MSENGGLECFGGVVVVVVGAVGAVGGGEFYHRNKEANTAKIYYRNVSYTYTGTVSIQYFTVKTESMHTEDRESLSQ